MPSCICSWLQRFITLKIKTVRVVENLLTEKYEAMPVTHLRKSCRMPDWAPLSDRLPYLAELIEATYEVVERNCIHGRVCRGYMVLSTLESLPNARTLTWALLNTMYENTPRTVKDLLNKCRIKNPAAPQSITLLYRYKQLGYKTARQNGVVGCYGIARAW